MDGSMRVVDAINKLKEKRMHESVERSNGTHGYASFKSLPSALSVVAMLVAKANVHANVGRPCAFYVEITAEEARAILDRTNSKNRKIRPQLVAKYRADFRHGRFAINHQGIAFDILGWLIDGQHRLTALAEEGGSHTFLVTVNLPVDARAKIDIGGVRNPADTLGMLNNEPYAKAKASLIANIAAGLGGDVRVPPYEELLARVEKYDLALSWMAPHWRQGGRSTGVRRAPILAAFAYATPADPARVAALFEEYLGDLALPGSPMRRLHTHVLNAMAATSREVARELFLVALSAIGAALAGETPQMLRIHPTRVARFRAAWGD